MASEERRDATTAASEGKPEGQDKDKERRDLPEVPPIQTRHEITVDGRTLTYYAMTGMLPLKNDKGETEAQVFFIAYTLNTPEGDPKRPLTFAFNGGPGSASIWLHMGALGPKRVQLNDDGTMPPPPFSLVDNEETWLTETDLVFVDPVGTGYSRAAKPDLDEKYWGYKGDIESLGEFIRLYLTRYRRWTSPLFLAGESYGTLRAGGLAGHLIDKGIAFNGVVLVSATLSYMTLWQSGDRGNDLPYALFLPAYTATAWYHHQLPDDLQSRDLEDVLAEVEQWVVNDYLVALVRGDTLSDDQRQAVIQQVARYTGLDERYVDNSELRIQIMRFCKELLRDQKKTVGRLDSRFTGMDVLAVTEMPDYDPSLTQPTPPFTATFNDYIRRDLGFETDLEYETLNMKVNEKWKFDATRQGFLETAEALRRAFARNPYMKVLVAYGYYDLATPYFAIMYTVNHMGIDRSLRGNVQYAGYESGHMMYIDKPSRVKMKEDVVAFMRDALPG